MDSESDFFSAFDFDYDDALEQERQSLLQQLPYGGRPGLDDRGEFSNAWLHQGFRLIRCMYWILVNHNVLDSFSQLDYFRAF